LVSGYHWYGEVHIAHICAAMYNVICMCCLCVIIVTDEPTWFVLDVLICPGICNIHVTIALRTGLSHQVPWLPNGSHITHAKCDWSVPTCADTYVWYVMNVHSCHLNRQFVMIICLEGITLGVMVLIDIVQYIPIFGVSWTMFICMCGQMCDNCSLCPHMLCAGCVHLRRCMIRQCRNVILQSLHWV
jgi:hypothetical protein